MNQTVQNLLQELTTLIQSRFESAQERVQTTDHERMSRYYKGQADTLRLVLHDIDALKFEFGMELTPEAFPEIPEVQEETPSIPVKQEKPVKTKGRALKPQTPPVPPAPVFTYKALAQEAVDRGIIARKISHFYHDLLPGQHVKGYDALYQAFEDSEELCEAIKKALETLPEQPQSEVPQSQEQPGVEVPPPPAPIFTYKALAQKAVAQGVIARRISHFYHDLLPGQHVKGYDTLYQAFEDSEELREAIKKALETLPEQPQPQVPPADPHAQQEQPQKYQEQAGVETPPADPHAQDIEVPPADPHAQQEQPQKYQEQASVEAPPADPHA